MCVHVVPPSSDRYTPSPQVELCRLFGSPVPAHTTFGSLGAMAMSPMESAVPYASKTGSQVTPLFRLRKIPPDAVPTKTMLGLSGTASMSSMRPPNDAGPMCLQLAEPGHADSTRCAGTAGGCVGRGGWAIVVMKGVATTARTTAMRIRISGGG